MDRGCARHTVTNNTPGAHLGEGPAAAPAPRHTAAALVLQLVQVAVRAAEEDAATGGTGDGDGGDAVGGHGEEGQGGQGELVPLVPSAARRAAAARPNQQNLGGGMWVEGVLWSVPKSNAMERLDPYPRGCSDSDCQWGEAVQGKTVDSDRACQAQDAWQGRLVTPTALGPSWHEAISMLLPFSPKNNHSPIEHLGRGADHEDMLYGRDKDAWASRSQPHGHDGLVFARVFHGHVLPVGWKGETWRVGWRGRRAWVTCSRQRFPRAPRRDPSVRRRARLARQVPEPSRSPAIKAPEEEGAVHGSPRTAQLREHAAEGYCLAGGEAIQDRCRHLRHGRRGVAQCSGPLRAR